MDDRTAEIVENNLGLVGDRVKKLNLNFQESEEMFHVGVIGLIKAAEKYDPTRNTTFATYACRCIDNEFYMEFRKRKKHNKVTSLETPILVQEDENLVLGDTIQDTSIRIEDDTETNERVEIAIDIILNHLGEKNRRVVLLSAAGYIQARICKELNYSQSYVSRIMKKSNSLMEGMMNSRSFVRNAGKYQVEVINQMLIITFDGVQDEVEKQIYDIDFEEYIPMFEISSNDEKVSIKVPADTDSMCFLARVVDKLDKKA